jgi:hypothetical protein
MSLSFGTMGGGHHDKDSSAHRHRRDRIEASGGSLDGAGPAIAGGMLLVNSGYGVWGGMPGNVLLAFSIDGK